MDKIVILNKHKAMLIFRDKPPVYITSDRDVREMIYWMFDIHRNIINDDITQAIDMEEVA